MAAEPFPDHNGSLTEQEKTAVHDQLERLLGSPYFNQSRRFPAFLRYVVGKTLAGEEDALKERTLGMEIFGRQADYDTASDPIVRVTAAEIRKRIALYYQEPGRDAELRIALTSGSYIPQFHSSASEKGRDLSGAGSALLTEPIPNSEGTEPSVPPHHHFWRGFAASLAIVAIVAAAAVWGWRATHRSPFDFFWGPILNSNGPVLFCVADQKQYSSIALFGANDQSRQTILPDSLTAVVIDDLSPIVHVAGLLQTNGKHYSLRGESATTLMDLRSGPAVFIGAFDNAWTLRLTSPLRYRFFNDTSMTEFGIADSRNPSMRWIVNRQQQMATNNYRDYAIIARFTDSITGEPAVVVAGVARGGTIAAGEFLTDPQHLAQLMHAAKAAGNKQNMEIVLSTEIIGGEPGTPEMVASYFW